jgi:hypothetical protein
MVWITQALYMPKHLRAGWWSICCGGRSAQHDEDADAEQRLAGGEPEPPQNRESNDFTSQVWDFSLRVAQRIRLPSVRTCTNLYTTPLTT